MDNFPQLKEAGGYELLRVGTRSRNLAIPPGGYTAQYLMLFTSTEDILRLFCDTDKVTEGNRIQISQLRDEFVDEVIEVDTTKLESVVNFYR